MNHPLDRRQFLARAAAGVVALGAAPAILRAADEQWGDLAGQLIYDGKAPERPKLKVDKDLDCCGKFDIRDESLVVAADGGLANVYVWVRSKSVQICPELKKSVKKQVVLDNRDCIFQPHCLVIWQTEQELSIVNSDPVAQNVAFSPPGDAPANIVLPPPPHEASKAVYKFQRKQNLPVPIHCNYHPWESAYILARDNPYFAVTKPDGTFRIERLPVGQLEFQVWQERPGGLQTPQWPKGRFTTTIKPGANDLGTIRLKPEWLVKK